MIYLGVKEECLKEYAKEAICWLGIKIKGRYTSVKTDGYKCSRTDCQFCNSNMAKRKSVNQEFRDLFTIDLIKELVCALPSRLIDISDQLKEQYIALGFTATDFNSEAKKIFVSSGYTGWFLNKDKYDVEIKWNYRLSNLLNTHTCSYCNREYIFVYENKSGGKGMVPQFDHWFSKSDQPLLALSFYNLVPSCATCNGIKSDIDMNLTNFLHPYVDSNISNSYEFSYWFKEVHKPEIILKKGSVESDKGINTFEALNLELIYKGHSDKELKDLYDLRYKYSDNYLKVLLEKTFSSHLLISDQEKYRLIFGIELGKENYHKRIMSKFKNDIINKLLKKT